MLTLFNMIIFLTRNQGFMAHLINLPIYLSISFAKCESPICESPICESPICEAVWPPTASHGLSDLIGSDRSHEKMWEAVCERVQIRPPTDSHGLSDPVPSNLIGSFGLPRPTTASHSLSRPLTYWLSQSDYWEQGQRVRGRPWEADFDKFLTFDSNSTSDDKSIRCAKNIIMIFFTFKLFQYFNISQNFVLNVQKKPPLS